MSAEEKEEAAKGQAKKLLVEQLANWQNAGGTGKFSPDLDPVIAATGLEMEQVRGVWGNMVLKGEVTLAEEPEQAEGDTTIVVKQEKGGRKPGGTEPERRITTPAVVDPLSEEAIVDYCDEVKMVARSLVGVSGLSENGKKAILEKLQAERDIYFGPTSNPGLLSQALINGGLPWYKVNGILTEFGMIQAQKVGPMGQTAWGTFGANPWAAAQPPKQEEEKFEKMFDRVMKLKQMELMGNMLGTQGNPGAGRSDRIDKIMDRVDESRILTTALRDETGLGSGGMMTELVTELEPVVDDEGKEVTDKTGALMTRPARTVRRPVSVSGRSSGGGSDFDKILTQMAQIQMIKMLGQGGTGNVPQGMASTYEPMINEETGEPMLDKAGQPIMRVHYDLPGAGGRGSSDIAAILQLADKSQETALKVAELMRPKGASDTDAITSMMVKRIDALSDSQIKMLQDQVTAMQSQDPLGYVADLMDKLKKVGAFGGDKAQSLDVAKLTSELDRWKFEKDDEFKKWAWKQRQDMEDKKYARKQLDEFGKTIREGIEKVGKPLADGFAKGYGEGRRGGNGGASGRQERSQGQDRDVKQMNDEELDDMRKKIETAKSTVNQAEKNVVAEIQRRGR